MKFISIKNSHQFLKTGSARLDYFRKGGEIIEFQDLSNVSDIEKIALLAQIIPSKVGSPLSIKSLSEGLENDH